MENLIRRRILHNLPVFRKKDGRFIWVKEEFKVVYVFPPGLVC